MLKENFAIISYLLPLSEVPTSLQQLTVTSLPTHILNFSSYLTSCFFLYNLFILLLSSLLIVLVASCSFLYSLLLILQFSSLLIKKKTTGRNESLPKSPRKLISL